MISLFICIGTIVVQCLGNRFCEIFPTTMFQYYIQGGIVELMLEVPIVGALVLKIYRSKHIGRDE